ncbi:MAG: DAK2 domain-containing protein [Dehalococcoidia bacterium]
MTNSTNVAALSGRELFEMMDTATRWLERNAEAVNAINVFPVPDGDTGTNMALTMRAAVDAADGAAAVAEVMQTMARGALMGARGNSGVILSQLIRGLAGTLDLCDRVGGAELAGALSAGASAARAAVTNPVEGTILTVASEAATGARQAAAGTEEILPVMAAAVAAAHEALQRTPELLPVLREAGVVDSGGLGLTVLLDGALIYLRGESLPETAADAGQIDSGWLSETDAAHGHDEGFGYCTEFIVSGIDIALDTLRTRLQGVGESVLVVGEPSLARIHVHTQDPGQALSLGAAMGRLSKVKVDDMEAQADQLAALVPPTGPLSFVAVAAGRGLIDALRAAGAERVVTGGQTMNPSTEEILRAIDASHGEHVFVLPNNKNIIWTAEQAAKLAKRSVDVVPTRSVPQGIAALLAVNPEAAPEENLEAMRGAIAGVRTIEVTRAARGVTIGGVAVSPEQPIALIDDELTDAADTAEEAVLAALARVGAERALVTVFLGRDTEPERGEALAARVQERFAGAEVEVLPGGQPFYDYVISVE